MKERCYIHHPYPHSDANKHFPVYMTLHFCRTYIKCIAVCDIKTQDNTITMTKMEDGICWSRSVQGGVSNCWTGIRNRMMEWKNGMEKWTYTVAANSCNWHWSLQVELPSVSTGLLSHCRVLWASTAFPTIMLLYPSMVLLLAHHQMLCYCSLAKPDSHMKSKSLALQDYSYGSVFRDKNMMAEISARSSVFSLWSSSCTLILSY